jgi:micrococcal nuclease
MSRLSRYCCIPFYNMFMKRDDPIIKWDDTIPFVFPIDTGQVIKVYDGDTITIASKMPYTSSPMYRFSVRLNGIDTPEIKGKTEDEKTIAVEARNKLTDLIMNQRVTLKNVQNEKYGRILADVYLGDLHINQWMLDQHFAVKYDGGTKNAPESWMRYRLTGKL